MKVLILTKHEHLEFVKENYLKFHDKHSFYVWANPDSFTWDERYDIGISYMYQYKVPAKELSHTWFNFHPAPLPEYKGRNLCYHAIMNGEKSFGASVHYMDENFDTGDIIDVGRFPVLVWDTAGDVSRKALETSEMLFEEYFPRIIAGEKFKIWKNVGGTYYKQHPIPEFLQRFDDYTAKEIRAITYGSFYPKIDIGGVVYKIVRDDEKKD